MGTICFIMDKEGFHATYRWVDRGRWRAGAAQLAGAGNPHRAGGSPDEHPRRARQTRAAAAAPGISQGSRADLRRAGARRGAQQPAAALRARRSACRALPVRHRHCGSQPTGAANHFLTTGQSAGQLKHHHYRWDARAAQPVLSLPGTPVAACSAIERLLGQVVT